MADETITTPEGKNPLDSRLKDLLDDKTKLAQEVASKDNALKEANDKFAALERENTFNSGFADVLGTHQAAKDHKEEIRAKVLGGYSVEDATFAVLGKAGKLGGNAQAPVVSPAGGSAATTMPQGGTKAPSDMSQAERREALAKELIWS